MKLRKKQFKKYVKWLSKRWWRKMAVMRIVKNNNFSIVSNSIIGDKMSRKVGTKCPLTLGQNVPEKFERSGTKC